MIRRARLGVLGGTFDPVHIGHLLAATHARAGCALDEVLLVVANEPWQKAHRTDMAPAEVRFAAVAAAVAGHEGLVASRMEIDRGGTTYTVDTLRQLRSSAPEAELYLVVGTDAARGVGSWREADVVADLADLVVVDRAGVDRPQLGPHWRVHWLEMPAVDVSSTDVRDRFADGRPVDFLVPDAALDVLRAAGLYAGGAEAFERDQ